MSNLKMVQVGTDINDNPVYNVMNEDDKLVTTTIMTEAEAKAMIEGTPDPAPVEEVVEKAIEEAVSTDAPNYESMTKVELESLMRDHGIELDRRKTKSDLLAEVDEYFASVLHTPNKEN
tara:strand:- start:352 stop:708 length:357 start_codon:yes stop_codon:yes gene_type:complete